MFPKIRDIELKQMSQNSVFLIPFCLFCENSAAFTFLSDGPENPGSFLSVSEYSSLVHSTRNTISSTNYFLS